MVHQRHHTNETVDTAATREAEPSAFDGESEENKKSNDDGASEKRPAGGLRRRALDRFRSPRDRTPRQRHRLLEDHYRVDTLGGAMAEQQANPAVVKKPPLRGGPSRTNNVVVLPGVPRYEANWARDSHDFFNLVVLVPITALNVMNWNWDILLEQFVGIHRGGRNSHRGSLMALQDAWTGDWFDVFFAATVLYFLVDLLWILLVPASVKSPATIIQHHIATLLYISIPYIRPECRWCMGACMIVELNTWFLIARRVFNKQGFPPWTIDLGSFLSIRVKVISVAFYFTWITIRCILYPALLVAFFHTWMDRSKVVGTRWNVLGLSVPLHAVFCLLNFKWSYELLMSKIRYWRRLRQRRQQQQQQQQLQKGGPYKRLPSNDAVTNKDNGVSEGL